MSDLHRWGISSTQMAENIKRLNLKDIMSSEGLKRDPSLPHVTKEQMANLAAVLENDVSLYEEFHTLVLCGLEEYAHTGGDRETIAEKVATCLLLVAKGTL